MSDQGDWTLAEGWDEPIETGAGQMRWEAVARPFGSRLIWFGMVLHPESDRILVGFLSVEDPATVDPETRRDSDPTDRRVETIWLQKALRGSGIGTAMGKVADEFRLYESHSSVRTDAGKRWGAAVDGADPDEVNEVPDSVDFDRGAHRAYRVLLLANPDLREYVTP